ncbi:ParD-like family protein [Klebsiella pneumoniae]|uniref:ParD-like family protein n=1 Tax=Klebsiella pneumoniae TaxID=573 RepID=UPI001D0F1ADE|nr:ParD-like family protein [Klebsiella pneumoniae]
MGIVKISDLLHDDIRDASKAMSRSVNAQAEYWIRLGMMSELYPELNHQQIKLLMLKSGSDRLLEVINAINNHYNRRRTRPAAPCRPAAGVSV